MSSNSFWRNFRLSRFSWTKNPILPLYNFPVRRSMGSSAPTGRLSLSQRVKDLTKKYGWWALGVYLGISAIDFGISFAFVRTLGTEKIGYIEQSVVGSLRRFFNWEPNEVPSPDEPQTYHSSIWTEMVVAYGIHKALIVARLPITAAIVPPLVKRFRGRNMRLR
ncbi:N alpha-acetylation like protein Nat2 [Schizosaccharomyces cryophilus OY26]|uniref:N alpha-acetylation like protein Nat2 n=1 Tax=Schizosaccharomyces cryophilus (strain OY26 / ATCC MYA-4695 / CBS 11777 / NBRC 106824 / NRRL Y48691) TaxID=653667 RepID=S9XBD2_SCHCR|nr:N alpha-acetylation like protein Nat2 [Schizosaccharomyces cryophilus OY26]EPY51071.1 N alpha-acetylation like protein Nat2 [Schizosaccharomyces cryophilus OY26]